VAGKFTRSFFLPDRKRDAIKATYLSSSRFQLKHVTPKKDFLLLALSELRPKLFH
jgi:hypothetical protein